MSMIREAMAQRTRTVLLAEDSDHDIRAVRRVWEKLDLAESLRIVMDGAECLDYLMRQGRFAEPESCPWPSLLLLDLNLPLLDGFEVLRRIKENPRLRKLPVVALSTSCRQEDIELAYELGANAYFTKPFGLQELGNLLQTLTRYWELAGLPGDPADESQ